MKSLSQKTATAISIILISTIVLTLFAMPAANAHTGGVVWNFPSYPYLVASPNPVGVGQAVSIVMWIDYPLPSANVANDIRRHDYTLTITKPDGKIVTQHWDVVLDTTSIQYYSYIPDVVGTYNLKFDYAGQTYTWSGTYQNDTYAPATKTATFVVQEEQLPQPIASYPLPTEYWARPIEGQNTDWSAISSNWLGSPQIDNRVQPDGIAPNSPHIMWSKPIQYGGVVGGENVGVEGNTYYMGGSYNVRFSNPLIMYGTLYYQEPYGNSGSGGDYIAVDLRTGTEQWRINASALGAGVPSFGYTYGFDDGNQHGVLPNGVLFVGGGGFGGGAASWRGYDPRTGVLTTWNITNVPSGTAVLGPKGEIIRYAIANLGNTSNPNWVLTQWNSSKLFSSASGLGPSNWYSGTIPANCPTTPRPASMYWNGSTWVSNSVRSQQGYVQITSPAYDYNASLALPNGASWSINRAKFGNMMLVTQGGFGGRADNYYGGNWYGANITAVSLKPDSFGTVMWSKYFPAPPGNVTRDLVAWDPDAGVFVFEDRELLVHYGYSLADGSLLWGPTAPAEQYDYFRSTTRSAYGKIFFAGYGGVLYCYDIKTGNKLWSYGNGGEGNSTSSGLYTAWGVYPIFMPVIADGKIYLATTEHSPGSPYYKNVKYRCVNATDGTEIWTLMGWGTGMDANYDIVADGFFVFLNCYDMQVYCVGKGPSALTVSAPDVGVEVGSPLVIRGTVTDIAAGTEQDVIARRFPNGVPAMSDASMEGWMEYVYMQKPKPTDAAGVPVTIDVIDSNNNYRNIGTATSDASGLFTFSWTPDIEGDYKVVATFAGSESYWPSSSETSFVAAPAPTAPVYPEAPIDNTPTMITYSAVGIIAAVAIVGAVLALLVIRKRQ